MQKTLTKIFNEIAATTHEAFPQQLKNLVVLLIPSVETPVYISPEMADRLTKNTVAVKDAINRLGKDLHARNWVGLASKNYQLAGTSVNMIALRDNISGIFSPQYTQELRAIFVLDHEIGHHVVKNGYYDCYDLNSFHLAECAADAYAMLRHIQRFGKNTALAEFSGTGKSIVLFSDTAHYTTDTYQRVVKIAEERNISDLSLKETAELAAKIALETTIDIKILGKIRTAFESVYKACQEKIGRVENVTQKLYQGDKEAYALFCWETISVMRKHWNDLDILKAGKSFLSYPPIKQFIEESAKTDAAWKYALDSIDQSKKQQIPQRRVHLK